MPRRSMSLILGSALECLRRLDRRDQGEDSPAIPRRTDIEDAQAGACASAPPAGSVRRQLQAAPVGRTPST